MQDIIYSILIFPFSLWLISMGIKRLIALRRIRKNGIPAKGFVYEMNGTKPIIRFTTRDDEWVTAEHPKGGIFEKGDTVRVTYNPANPKEFFIQNFATRSTPYVLIVGGILAITTGVLSLLHIIPWHT